MEQDVPRGRLARADGTLETPVRTFCCLQDRWIPLEDFDRDPPHRLYAPLEPEQRRFADQPFLPADLGWNWWQEETTRTLDNVWSEAMRQTRWRWRLMVNQSDEAFFMYRPFDRERLRDIGGEELQLWQNLRVYETEGADFRAAPPARRILVVYHPAADERLRQVFAMAELLTIRAYEGHFDGALPSQEALRLLFDREHDRLA